MFIIALYQTLFRLKVVTIKNNMFEQNLAKRFELDHFEKTFMETTENLIDCGKAIERSENNIFVKSCKSHAEKVLAKKKMKIVNNVFEAGCASLKTFYFEYTFLFLKNFFDKMLSI